MTEKEMLDLIRSGKSETELQRVFLEEIRKAKARIQKEKEEAEKKNKVAAAREKVAAALAEYLTISGFPVGKDSITILAEALDSVTEDFFQPKRKSADDIIASFLKTL